MTYQKGQSGNPGGNRTQKPITDALCLIVTDKTTRKLVLPKNATIAYEIALNLIRKARDGHLDSIKEVLDRVEGKSAASVNVDHSGAIAVFTAELSPITDFLEEFTISGEEETLRSDVSSRPLLSAPVRPE